MKNLIQRALLCAIGCVTGLSVLPASAAVSVGDKPELSVDITGGGGTIDLAKLKGKIVLVDFWATWCGPCMAEAPHMVAINNKYAARGLQIIGISKDQDVATMLKVAKDKGLVWPQHIDAGPVSAQFGVNGIPHAFLIGPDGTLLWEGHPGALDPEIEKAFKEHPPILIDPKVLKQGQDIVAKAQAKLDGSDATGAIKLMSQLPKEAKADPDLSIKVTELNTQLNAAAETMLAEVDPLIAAKDYIGAITRLKELSAALAGSPVATKAKGKLAELSSTPEVKAALGHAKSEKASADALDTAKKLKAAGKNAQAYPKFKSIVTAYAGTAAATEAAAIVKEYEKDTSFIHQANDEESGVKARGALSVARSYAKAGKIEQARAKYESILKDFAGSSVVEAATQELAALPKS